MNGRMLSRAIHRTSPATMAAAIRTATRGESGANRRSPGPAVGSMNGGGGRPCHPSRQGGRQDRRRRKARARPWCRRLPDVERPSGPATSPADGQPAGTAEARREEPGEAPVAARPPALAARPRPRRDRTRARRARAGRRVGRGDRRDRAAGLSARRAQPARDRIRGARPGADGARGRAGRPRPHRDAAHLGRPRVADRLRAARLASHRPVRRLARGAGARRPGRGGRLPDRARRGRRGRRAQDAIRSLLAARSLPRERQKGGTTVAYDLRPLLADLAVAGSGPAGRRPGPDAVRSRSLATAARRRWSRRSAARPSASRREALMRAGDASTLWIAPRAPVASLSLTSRPGRAASLKRHASAASRTSGLAPPMWRLEPGHRIGGRRECRVDAGD